jgi:hypothetical protein
MSIDFTWPKTCSQTCPSNSKSVRVVKRILMTSFDVPIKCDPVKWVEFNWCQHIVPSDCKWFHMFLMWPNDFKWSQMNSTIQMVPRQIKWSHLISNVFKCFVMTSCDLRWFQVSALLFSWVRLSQPPILLSNFTWLYRPIETKRETKILVCVSEVGRRGTEFAFGQATHNWEIISRLACMRAV